MINVEALEVKQGHQKIKEQLGMALWGRASNDVSEQGLVVCLVGSSIESQTQKKYNFKAMEHMVGPVLRLVHDG